MPPSESPPRTRNYSEPFRLDYAKWAAEIAQLSLREPNLVAWSLDDFSHNTRTFTPACLRAVLEAARQINPKLAFVPCCYYRHVTPSFAETYRPWLDGVLFPYRNESGEMNLQNRARSRAKSHASRNCSAPQCRFLLMSLPPTLALNDRRRIRAGGDVRARRCADGVLSIVTRTRPRSP